MERQCLYCKEILRGRADKKYCDDHCRNAYNNQHNRDATNLVRNVNNVLRKNRRLLKQFNPDGTARIKKIQLESKGFNFGFYTNIYTTKTNKCYYFCYDQGYLDTQDGYLTLVVKQDWVM